MQNKHKPWLQVSSPAHASAVLSILVSMTTGLIQLVFMKITLISPEPLGFHANQYFPNLWIIRSKEQASSLLQTGTGRRSLLPRSLERVRGTPWSSRFPQVPLASSPKTGSVLLTSQILFLFLKGKPGRAKSHSLPSAVRFVLGALGSSCQ